MEITNIAVPQCWQDFADVTNAGIDRVILFGPPGTGKSYAGLNSGLNEGQTSYRLVCTEDMTSANVEGMFLPNAEGGFTWLDGSATKAWRTGGRLVIDECDKASGDVSALLLAYTDSVASSVHDLPNGERISPAKGFSVIMTSNIESPYDLPEALKDRFPVALEINAPHPHALASLPADLRVVANAVISAEPERRSSLRSFYAFDKLRSQLGLERAATLAFGAERGEAVIDTLRVAHL
jgi:MoxR-like ATPase